MKILILILALSILTACDSNSQDQKSDKPISVDAISSEMGCENCNMNLKKFIATGHAIKLKNEESHYYCSINCSSIANEHFGENVKTIYGIDYGLTKYFPVDQLNYVIGSKLRGTMTRVSKFAFSDEEKAQSFMQTFEGKQIVGYEEAHDMSMEEIASRKKK